MIRLARTATATATPRAASPASARVRVALIVSVLCAMVLTGCTDPYTDEKRDGGITPQAAESALLSIPGISAANYDTHSWYSPGEGGMFSAAGMDIELTITVDPEYSIADHVAFFDYVAATAWSVNDHYPKGSVTVQLTGGEDVNFDWQPVAVELFGKNAEFYKPSTWSYDDDDTNWLNGERALSLGTSFYGKRYGRWPSTEVPTPSGLLHHEPVTALQIPAFTEPHLSTYDSQENSCYFVTLTRGGSGVTFGGDITVTVNDETGTEVDSAVLEDRDSAKLFCFDLGERPPRVTVDLTSGDFEGYDFVPVTMTVTRIEDPASQ